MQPTSRRDDPEATRTKAVGPLLRLLRHAIPSLMLGVLAGALTIAAIEWAGHQLLGRGGGPALGPVSDAQAGVALLAWLLGAATGAALASRWHAGASPAVGLSAALFLWGATGLTLWFLPHPRWAALAALGLMPVVGWWAARRAVSPQS